MQETVEQRLMRAAREAGMYPRNLAVLVKEFLLGGSYRDVAYRVGVSKTTVEKLAAIGRRAGIRRLCACGRLLEHKGHCAQRVAASFNYNPLFGRMRKAGDKPGYLIAIEKATAHIGQMDLRNDVRQELCLKFLSNGISEENFTTEAERIRILLIRDKYRSVSIYDELPNGLRIIDSLTAGEDGV